MSFWLHISSKHKRHRNEFLVTVLSEEFSRCAPFIVQFSNITVDLLNGGLLSKLNFLEF